MALVLKTSVPQGTVGSNPTLSANKGRVKIENCRTARFREFESHALRQNWELAAQDQCPRYSHSNLTL